MNLGDPLKKLLAGVVFVGLGILLFVYASKESQEEKGKIQYLHI